MLPTLTTNQRQKLEEEIAVLSRDLPASCRTEFRDVETPEKLFERVNELRVREAFKKRLYSIQRGKDFLHDKIQTEKTPDWFAQKESLEFLVEVASVQLSQALHQRVNAGYEHGVDDRSDIGSIVLKKVTKYKEITKEAHLPLVVCIVPNIHKYIDEQDICASLKDWHAFDLDVNPSSEYLSAVICMWHKFPSGSTFGEIHNPNAKYPICCNFTH
ncbi:MAG: hypothetical protein WCX61_03385 [Candidatus Peribacteraceae bacterium]|jgi:hypothetical protein